MSPLHIVGKNRPMRVPCPALPTIKSVHWSVFLNPNGMLESPEELYKIQKPWALVKTD